MKTSVPLPELDLSGDKPQSWVHLMPSGEAKPRDGRSPWRVSDPEAVIAATRRHHGSTDIPIDYDHQMVFATAPGRGGTAKAAGWIKQLEARANGIWGLVHWTAAAAAALRAGEYRYLSPYFSSDKATGEVTRILNAGLTNTPALEMTAVASRQGDTMDEIEGELRSLLKLPDGASGQDVLDAVRTLTTASDAASIKPDEYVPIAVLEKVTAELHRVSKGVSLETATVLVDQAVASGRLVPAMRDWAMDLCQANRPAFDGFIERTGTGLQQVMTHTTASRGAPPSDADAVTDPIMKGLGLSHDDIKKYGN